jgi:hypothetical protein
VDFLAHETWEGSAELTGYGAVVHERYPIRGRRVDDVTGEHVDFEISEPREIPVPLGLDDVQAGHQTTCHR